MAVLRCSAYACSRTRVRACVCVDVVWCDPSAAGTCSSLPRSRWPLGWVESIHPSPHPYSGTLAKGAETPFTYGAFRDLDALAPPTHPCRGRPPWRTARCCTYRCPFTPRPRRQLRPPPTGKRVAPALHQDAATTPHVNGVLLCVFRPVSNAVGRPAAAACGTVEARCRGCGSTRCCRVDDCSVVGSGER